MTTPAPTPIRSPLPDQTDDAFQQAMLQSVNSFRARHGLAPVTIDPNLVTAAKNRVQVVSTYDMLSENHQGAIAGLGENLFWGSSSGAPPNQATDATNAWYSEILDYNFTTASANPGQTTGHFTQLVWAATTTIGAARAAGPVTVGSTSPDYETYIAVEFSPAGNMAGQFAANVLAPTAGQNDHATLRWTSSDGTAWTPDILMSSHQTAAGPAAALANLIGLDTLYCAHRGSGDAYVWYTTWGTDTRVPNCTSGSTPALAQFSGKLYCVHRGNDPGTGLWVTIFDGMNWSTDTIIPGASTAAGPALAVFNNTLYCAHRGAADGGVWVTTTADGATWSTDTHIPNVGTAAGPALAVFNNTLYCAHRGAGDSGLWVTSTPDGATWSTDTRIPSVATAAGPALTVFNNTLYLAYRGDGTDTNLRYITSADGKTWSAENLITGVTSTMNPALAVYHGRLYLVHRS